MVASTNHSCGLWHYTNRSLESNSRSKTRLKMQLKWDGKTKYFWDFLFWLNYELSLRETSQELERDGEIRAQRILVVWVWRRATLAWPFIAMEGGEVEASWGVGYRPTPLPPSSSNFKIKHHKILDKGKKRAKLAKPKMGWSANHPSFSFPFTLSPTMSFLAPHAWKAKQSVKGVVSRPCMLPVLFFFCLPLS